MHDWQHIAELYGPLVWRVAYRILQNQEEAADCHQEVFVDAMRRTGNLAVENWAPFLRWLTVRRALDRLRSKNRRFNRFDSKHHVEEISVESVPGSDAEWNELIDIVRRELTNIPASQAQVFWLHCIEEISISDVASQLDVTENHVRVLLYRSRERLRAALKRNHPSLTERPKK
jgi:RNA polymerase sigma-70 factor (ECF subfamily)